MHAPTSHWLAMLALTATRALAAGSEAPASAGLITDSDGQPVRSSSGECWFSSTGAPGIAVNCPPPGSDAAPVMSADATGTGAATSPSAGWTRSAPSEQILPGSAYAPANARGNPGYLTDSNGWVIRSSRGDCWRTGSWTPALATVIGCDGVLAKAVPVPIPAPSPQPEPPSAQSEPPAGATEVAPAAPADTTEPPLIAPDGGGPATPQPPSPAPSSAAPPTVVTPSAPTPPAAKAVPDAPSPAAPRRREVVPIAPPAPPSPAPSAAAPRDSARESADTSPDRTDAMSEKVTLDTDTYFNFDKATLKPAGRQKLEALAARIRELTLEVIVATGHADWTGSTRYNQKLSERRALAVKRYLTKQGVPEARIFTEGKGEKQPVASNATRAGRAQNRRVDVEVIGTRDR